MGDDVDISLLSPTDLEKLKRPQLQRLCKQHGLRAAGKNVQLIAELSKLCCTVVSPSRRKNSSRADRSSPVWKKSAAKSHRRKRKASPLTPPDSPQSEQPSVELPSSKPSIEEPVVSPSSSGKPAKAPGRKRKRGGRQGKQSPKSQVSNDHSSPVKSPTSPRQQQSPKFSGAGLSQHQSHMPTVDVANTLKKTAIVPANAAEQAHPKKRLNDDVSPMPAAKRRRLPKSPVSPALSPQPSVGKHSKVSATVGPLQSPRQSKSPQTPKRQQTSQSRRHTSGRKQSSEKAQPRVKSPRKSAGRLSAAKARSPGKRTNPVRSAPSSSAKPTAKAGQLARRQSGQPGRLSSGRKQSSSAGSARRRTQTIHQSSGRQSIPGGTKRNSPAAHSQNSTGHRSPNKIQVSSKPQSPVPAVKAKTKMKSPILSRQSPSRRPSRSPGSSGRRLTFSKMNQTPSPGSSKEDLRATVLAELNVRVASKLPTVPAGGSSKIPRFLPAGTSAPAEKKTTSGKDWQRIHDAGFSKMKSISDHLTERQQQRLKMLGTQKTDGKPKPSAASISHTSAVGRKTDSHPKLVRASMACARPGGINVIDGKKKTPARPSMVVAGMQQAAFRPPDNPVNVTFNFGPKTPGKNTTTPGQPGGKQTPFKFGATPAKAVTPKPKFDLQASLQRRLNYKPYTGPINSSPKAKKPSPTKPVKPSGIPRHQAYKHPQTKTASDIRDANRVALQRRQKARRDQDLLGRRGLA